VTNYQRESNGNTIILSLIRFAYRFVCSEGFLLFVTFRSLKLYPLSSYNAVLYFNAAALKYLITFYYYRLTFVYSFMNIQLQYCQCFWYCNATVKLPLRYKNVTLSFNLFFNCKKFQDSPLRNIIFATVIRIITF
jgi:hypothetical protein